MFGTKFDLQVGKTQDKLFTPISQKLEFSPDGGQRFLCTAPKSFDSCFHDFPMEEEIMNFMNHQ